MGRRKPLSAGPKLQSRGANRSGAATVASEAEVSLPDRRGRVLPGASPKTTERSPEPLLQPSSRSPSQPSPGSGPRTPRPALPRTGSTAELYRTERGNAPLGPQLPSFWALRGFVYLNHAAAFRSAQSQRARIPTANGSRPRGFLNRPSPPIAARRP